MKRLSLLILFAVLLALPALSQQISVESFTPLENDLTANTALKSLNCSYNNLTRLNLSSCKKLKELDISSVTTGDSPLSSDETFPAFYDLRQYIRVSPVKNQGDFGLCWTFATYASLESFLLS